MRQSILDTNILSYFLKGDTSVTDRTRAYLEIYPYLSFSILTYYETKGGLFYRDAHSQMERFEQLAETSEIVDLDRSVADIASQIYSNLRQKGLSIEPVDLLIGATAISCDYTLITNNTKHFQNIPGLRYENWMN